MNFILSCALFSTLLLFVSIDATYWGYHPRIYKTYYTTPYWGHYPHHKGGFVAKATPVVPYAAPMKGWVEPALVTAPVVAAKGPVLAAKGPVMATTVYGKGPVVAAPYPVKGVVPMKGVVAAAPVKGVIAAPVKGVVVPTVTMAAPVVKGKGIVAPVVHATKGYPVPAVKGFPLPTVKAAPYYPVKTAFTTAYTPVLGKGPVLSKGAYIAKTPVVPVKGAVVAPGKSVVTAVEEGIVYDAKPAMDAGVVIPGGPVEGPVVEGPAVVRRVTRDVAGYQTVRPLSDLLRELP